MSRAASKQAASTTPGERIYQAFEQAAGQAAEKAARDPAVLAFGAAMLKSQFLFARSAQLAVEAALLQWDALRQVGAQMSPMSPMSMASMASMMPMTQPHKTTEAR